MKKFFILFYLALISVACSGPDENTPSIVGTWEVVDHEIRYPDTDWEPGEECRSDNVEEYKADGEWIAYDGTQQCGQSGTGIRHGTWRLTANDSKVVYTYEGIPGEYESTVEELTEDMMILSYSTGDVAGMQMRFTYTKL